MINTSGKTEKYTASVNLMQKFPAFSFINSFIHILSYNKINGHFKSLKNYNSAQS